MPPVEPAGPREGVGTRWFLAFALAALALLAGSGELGAQETIASDRPGIGSGSFALHPGTLQVEGGVGFSRGDSVDRLSLGQMLLRVGAFDGLELQGQLNSVVLDRGGEADREGLQDIGVGAKLRLTRDGPGGMGLSLLGTISFPTGSEFTSSNESVPGIALLADLPVADELTLSGNLVFGGWLARAEDLITLTLTPSYTLPSSTPIGVFLGYAGFYASSGNQHFLEGGLTWLPGPDLQLDANGGVDPESGDYFLGIGVATRWFF